MGEIAFNVNKFFENIDSIKDHRDRSWEHCYYFFRKNKNKKLDNREMELAELHLSFYLASWGMYRGSSFILQKDYTIFERIIKEIFNKKYFLLWDIEKNINQKDKLTLLFEELYSSIEKILINIKESIKEHKDLKGKDKKYLNSRTISHILVTKIILGTIGCIPAYDKFFVDGLGLKKFQKTFHRKKSFSSMIDFYLRNKTELDRIHNNHQKYPIMKIIDMYFWSIGINKND